MKKSIFLLIGVLLLTLTTAQAQLKYGLKAGLNLSNVSLSGDIDQFLDTENLTGFQVGPMIEFTVPIINVGFDAAVLYSQQGFKMKDEEGSYSFKQNTLEVPVNFKYKVTALNVAGAYLALGPYAAFNLSDNLKEQAKTKSFGAGLNFGLGVELLSKVQVGVNYKLGLTDDFSKLTAGDDMLGNLITGNAKQRGWTVSLAYFFN